MVKHVLFSSLVLNGIKAVYLIYVFNEKEALLPIDLEFIFILEEIIEVIPRVLFKAMRVVKLKLVQ
jgi:hypothetical protein